MVIVQYMCPLCNVQNFVLETLKILSSTFFETYNTLSLSTAILLCNSPPKFISPVCNLVPFDQPFSSPPDTYSPQPLETTILF